MQGRRTMPNFQSSDANATVFAENDGGGPGLYGYAKGLGQAPLKFGYGVIAVLGGDPNVFPVSMNGAGLIGLSDAREGIVGASSVASGVLGVSSSGAGVTGQRSSITDTSGSGVEGRGGAWGVFGQGYGAGVKGVSMFGSAGVGVHGESMDSNGVLGVSHHASNAAVSAVNDAGGIGLWAECTPGAGPAGHFRGDVTVEGRITATVDLVLPANTGDVCEHFAIAQETAVEPGTVMVTGDNELLRPCEDDYDPRVVGIVTGAGGLLPGITLGAGRSGGPNARIALVGTAYCLVDADRGRVVPGDLLTTSSRPGHAMKATAEARCLGAIVGKALAGLPTGQGLVPVLVMLR
jgi:hypothetical protein